MKSTWIFLLFLTLQTGLFAHGAHPSVEESSHALAHTFEFGMIGAVLLLAAIITKKI